MIDNGYFVGNLNGEITNVAEQKAYPNNAAAMPDYDPEITQPIHLFASQYVLQAAAKCVWTGVQIPLTSLPDSLGIKLTTNGLAFLIPQLQKAYGRDRNVTLVLKGDNSTDPIIKVDNTVGLDAVLKIAFYVDYEDENRHAVDLSLRLVGDVQGSLSNSVIALKINSLDIMSLEQTYLDPDPKTNMQPVEVNLLLPFLTVIVRTYLVVINLTYSSIPITLPKIPLFKITESEARVKNGYLEAGINLSLDL